MGRLALTQGLNYFPLLSIGFRTVLDPERAKGLSTRKCWQKGNHILSLCIMIRESWQRCTHCRTTRCELKPEGVRRSETNGLTETERDGEGEKERERTARKGTERKILRANCHEGINHTNIYIYRVSPKKQNT
ncbi:uncharacterized protein LOC143213136 [Lasioglossum baleicum]|uniref:uncharacterized protein LOC143213136 n=1 Tax=Lasioglossum baleicum TaxID=434251 RepID=UPI003FCD7C1E